ncbi:uncharaterized LOC112694756 homolog isoform X2 [Gopherus evgoodei]|uniref:uncharaterized LOC112694756 homolog isoform X2 n=1 Tax=Gopherus evgoodei TaxID=1825980 RepID=UPI0011D000F3|nr:uncharaterized LOC112694756 homolog isoform X2 [Gopherus evgoodei]
MYPAVEAMTAWTEETSLQGRCGIWHPCGTLGASRDPSLSGGSLNPGMATPTPSPSSFLLLPLPAIVFISVAAYLLLLLLILALRHCLLARGLCTDCCWCEKGMLGGPSHCCLACAEACNCAPPSLTRCLDTCCPRRQGWELSTCPPFPRCCPLCDCACAYQPPDCQSINCICFEVKLL